MSRQKTLKKEVSAAGIGVHSGKPCSIRFLPAPVDSGIIFSRTDLNPAVKVSANALYVNDTMLCTAMNYQGVRVATVEHLMSALAGLGIDNLLIELNSPEVPIMDGSSATFVYLFQEAGIREQDSPKRFIKILEEIEIREGDKYAKLSPYQGLRFDFTISFNHPVFKRRNTHFSLNFSTHNYIKFISRARTFGFLRDIEFLHSNSLGLGGSLENAVVVDEFRIMNEQGLRFEDEFVRHKLLDAVGDLYMLGAPILGFYQGYKSGHDLNNKLCRAVLNNPKKWEWVEDEKNEPDYSINEE